MQTNTILDILLTMRLSQARLCHCTCPKCCLSSGITRYNESSPWKMGFNIGGDETWMQQYEAIWKKVEELFGEGLRRESLSSGKYVNPKLISWNCEIRTGFRGTTPEPEDIGSCYAT